MRRDEPVPRRSAAGRRSSTAALACMVSLNDLADRPPHSHRRRAAGHRHRSACGSSPRRTCRTTGRAGCGSTRRPARCSPATCSRRWRRPRASPRTTSSSRRWSPRTCSTARRSAPIWCRRSSGSPTLEPTTLALMHGSSFRGDGATQLQRAGRRLCRLAGRGGIALQREPSSQMQLARSTCRRHVHQYAQKLRASGRSRGRVRRDLREQLNDPRS